MKNFWLSATVGLVSLISAASPAFALEMKELPPSVSVTGEGHAYASPDQASITMGVISEAKTASAALKTNNDKMTSLISTLKGKGIAEKDILTSNFSINPQYHYDNSSNGSQRATITGYQASNDVTVKIRKLGTLGDTLDAVVGAGANNVNGINFSLAEPAPVLDEARKKAVEDAKRKAELYASAAGVKVGRVLYITESAGMISPPRPMMARAMAKESFAAVPIATGEQESSASVTIIYSLE